MDPHDFENRLVKEMFDPYVVDARMSQLEQSLFEFAIMIKEMKDRITVLEARPLYIPYCQPQYPYNPSPLIDQIITKGDTKL